MTNNQNNILTKSQQPLLNLDTPRSIVEKENIITGLEKALLHIH